MRKLAVGLIIGIIVIEGWWRCDGYWENERNALMEIKASFVNQNNTSVEGWGTVRDCCLWLGVECDSSTGRVTYIHIYGSVVNEPQYSFNASLFLPFHQLTSLGFYQNNIAGCIHNHGFEKLSELRKLESLYLSGNIISQSSSILSSIGGISYLRSLIFVHNFGLEKAEEIQGLCKLKHLEELDISYNEIHGSLPWCMANLTSLKKLYLSSNHFSGSISRSPLRSLTSLSDLMFPNNKFQVPLSLEPFYNHTKLKYLDGQDNHMYDGEELDVKLSPKFQLETLFLSSNGSIVAFPKFLYHQHSLQTLYLSNIHLNEEFPYWLLVNNTRLLCLHLVNTALLGRLQLPIHSHKHLMFLDISKNHLNGTIPLNIGQLLPNINSFNLSENSLMGGIPSSLGNMSNLERLDLSYNWLSGEIPEDLFMGYNSLKEVRLSYNDFQGEIFSKQGFCNVLGTLKLDGNRFTGNIPDSLLNCSYWLFDLDASNNHLSGNIPRWIANMSDLQVLDLSDNFFSESLPTHFCPSEIREVYLSNNQLQGSLGVTFYNCSELMILDLSHNRLNGEIPKWIGSVSKLSYILLNHNTFQGELPIELCNLTQLSLVDLSNNNLSGRVLSCIRSVGKYMINKDYSNLHSSQYWAYMNRPLEFTTKSRTYEFQGSILVYISGIDLSCNNLTGEIPIEIGNLSMIQVLNLSHNSLTGPIPQLFANLKQIESLDLSYNNLSGKIPHQITQLPFLSDFSVAHNNLSGKTPEMLAQFATFDKSSYEGNPFLCGPPLLESCQAAVPALSVPITSVEEDNGFIEMKDFYMSFFISYIIVLLSIATVLYINPYWRRAWFCMIEVSLRSCYYFLEDIVFALKKLIRAS